MKFWWKKALLASGSVLFLGCGEPSRPASARPKEPTPKESTKAPFDAVGLWEVAHTDGKPFHIRINPDGTASTDWEGQEKGAWRVADGEIVIEYTDGWMDVLFQEGDQVKKRAFGPGTDRKGKPDNVTSARKIAEEPKPGDSPGEPHNPSSP
jgi:hypothetical protein